MFNYFYSFRENIEVCSSIDVNPKHPKCVAMKLTAIIPSEIVVWAFFLRASYFNKDNSYSLDWSWILVTFEVKVHK